MNTISDYTSSCRKLSRIRGENPPGFTLLEILIAMFIFAIVLSTIYTSYTGTFRILNETEEQTDIYRMARIALERMHEDLESVYALPSGESSEPDEEDESVQVFAFVGEDKEINGKSADSLSFISRAHLVFGEQEQTSGTAEIAYYVGETDEGEGLVLYRSDTPRGAEAPDEETDGLVLCEKLLSVDFTYYDAEGEEYYNWDSTTGESGDDRIPKMVSISLEFVNKSDPEAPFRFLTKVALPVGWGQT